MKNYIVTAGLVLGLSLVAEPGYALVSLRHHHTKKVSKPKKQDLRESFPPGENYFKPKHRLRGIGVSRQHMTADDLEVRVKQMTEAQTFIIMRDPRAVLWAQRLTDPGIQRIISQAAKKSEVHASIIEGIGFLESGGDPYAVSPTGPKGFMQFAKRTAQSAGLKVEKRVWYEKVPTKKLVRSKGKKPVLVTVYKKVSHTEVTDERLVPERAITQAALYLSRMTEDYGGEDFAVFAYHCGEGCVKQFLSLAKNYGLGKPTVAKLFFGASPVYRRDLYLAIEEHLKRDSSPTYWFRIKRAAELVELYKESPEEYKQLLEKFQNTLNPKFRMPTRLHFWYPPKEMEKFVGAKKSEEITAKELFPLPARPALYSFTAGASEQASAETIGTIAYISFETRRLWEAGHFKKERFVPINISAVIRPSSYRVVLKQSKAFPGLPIHSVDGFDVSFADLPPGEAECLRFILKDMGWDQYITYDEEIGKESVTHVAPSPFYAQFFKDVYGDMTIGK